MTTDIASPVPRSHDEEPRRATFGVPYPLGEGAALVFEKKTDLQAKLPDVAADSTKRVVKGKRITITLTLRTFEGVSFHECNFHDRQGRGVAEIAKTTFRRCAFRRSFFGTTRFYRVRFVECSFENCDFSNDEFEDCLFEQCNFLNCSAWHATFRRTQVDPQAFLQGMAFPAYNLTDKTGEIRDAIRREWLDARLRQAEQLYRSNSDVLDSRHSDSALLELKRAQHAWLNDLWRHGTADYRALPLTLGAAIRRAPLGPLRAGWRLALLHLTAGGTSARNLAGVLLLLVATYPFVLSALPITYNGTPCDLTASAVPAWEYVRLALLSASLLLGFGFTAFSASGALATAALVGGAVFGIFWYALLIPVLLRRVYR